MEAIIFGIIFIIVIIIALFVIFKPVIKDKKARKNVKNFDFFTQHYSFLLNCSQNEAIQRLSTKNTNDILEYSFDNKMLTICFSPLKANIEYQLSFYCIKNTTYLRVSRVKFLYERSNIPYMINSFFIEKIDAKPIDYTTFEKNVYTVSNPNNRSIN